MDQLYDESFGDEYGSNLATHLDRLKPVGVFVLKALPLLFVNAVQQVHVVGGDSVFGLVELKTSCSYLEFTS
jgi:hypothetical protein